MAYVVRFGRPFLAYREVFLRSLDISSEQAFS